MPSRHRSNPLALAVLVSLLEEPVHPYEIATRLRARRKHESVRLNYGSLYAVVAALQARGLIAPRETARQGRLPERTVYDITAAGRAELHDWLAELLSTPVKDYPALEAALTFLPPDEALALLEARAQSLEIQAVQDTALRRLMAERAFPRLFWLEAEFRMTLRAAELDYVRRLADDIRAGRLDGLDWWRDAHASEAPPRNPDPAVRAGAHGSHHPHGAHDPHSSHATRPDAPPEPPPHPPEPASARPAPDTRKPR